MSYALCLQNRNADGTIDLQRFKVYRVLLPEPLDPDTMIRIIDESGEDYLYSATRFVLIDLPEPPKAAYAVYQAEEDAERQAWSAYTAEELWAQLYDVEDAVEFLYEQIEELYLSPAEREAAHTPPWLSFRQGGDLSENSVAALLGRIRQIQAQLEIVYGRAETLPVTPILTPRAYTKRRRGVYIDD